MVRLASFSLVDIYGFIAVNHKQTQKFQIFKGVRIQGYIGFKQKILSGNTL